MSKVLLFKRYVIQSTAPLSLNVLLLQGTDVHSKYCCDKKRVLWFNIYMHDLRAVRGSTYDQIKMSLRLVLDYTHG